MVTTRRDGREVYRSTPGTPAQQPAVQGVRDFDAASIGGREELFGLCGRKYATRIVVREGNKFQIEFDGGTLRASLSGPDVSLLFGNQVDCLIENQDCDNLNLSRCIRLKLTDSFDDEGDYGECPGDVDWVIGSVWFSPGEVGSVG